MSPTEGEQPPRWHLPNEGLSIADAAAIFAEAAEFYRVLFVEVDSWGRGSLQAEDLSALARARRAHLHNLLDATLNLVETITRVGSGTWP